MNQTIAASHGYFGVPTLGAFWRVPGAVRPEGVVGTVADSTGTTVAHAVTAKPVVSAAVPGLGGRKRVSAVSATGQPSLGQPPFGQRAFGHTAVRKQYIYMTRVVANGDDAPGPHRWRVPV
jgi:hypothetical protein